MVAGRSMLKLSRSAVLSLFLVVTSTFRRSRKGLSVRHAVIGVYRAGLAYWR
jgi:hypothetical protein